MKFFVNDLKIDEIFNIVFLCGCKYTKDHTDKRNVLKAFLEKDKSINVIILEENFNFLSINSSKRALYYDDIFLKDLSQVESLAALFANKIYIIHETISTAAELGLFAGNSLLFHKTDLIVPNPKLIKSNPVTSFIRLAFFRNPDHKLGYKMYFDPYVCDEKTFFFDNNLNNSQNEAFMQQLSESIKSINKSKYSGFKKIAFKPSHMPDLVEYRIKSDTKNGKTKIEVYVGIDALKIQLLSMFLDNDIRRKLREELTISTHVSNLEKQYKELLMNSILMLENVDVDKKGFEVKIKDFDDIKIRQAIGLFLYFMQALKLIDITKRGITTDEFDIKLVLKLPLKNYDSIKKIICDKPTLFEERKIC